MLDLNGWSMDRDAVTLGLEVLKALAPVATALIALRALQNWRRQDRAKIQAQLLDDLIEAMHRFANDTAAPVQHVRIAQIGMKAYRVEDPNRTPEEIEIAGAAAWIEQNGRDWAKKGAEELDLLQTHLAKLRTLATKGQVFQFPNFKKCVAAVDDIAKALGQLLAFSAVLHSSTWNWENPEVRRVLLKTIRLDADSVQQAIAQASGSIAEFAVVAYKKIYG